VCRALCHSLDRDSELCLFGCLVRIFGQNFFDALPMEVFQIFSPNFLVVAAIGIDVVY
jgi:hypothetical protein